MSLADYFTMNLYKGKIYKTTNMLGQTLSQYCKNDSALNQEQRRIEREIATVEKNIWGDSARKDSLDSVAKADTKTSKNKRLTNRRATNSAPTSVRRNRRASSDGGSSVSGQARVTVRRQRH